MNTHHYTIESQKVSIGFESMERFLSSAQTWHAPLVYICDSNVCDYYPFLKKLSPVFFIEPSEEKKTLSTLELLFHFFYEHEIDKSFTAIIIGGGITCDIGALASALWHRGIQHILVPTTLLSMTDAAIGGKTGVNFELKKNQVGTFYYPQQIIIDISLLQSLSYIEFRQGLAEIVKHAIGFNYDLFIQLEEEKVQKQLLSKQLPLDLLQNSIQTKISIIQQDSNEKNIRKLLNIGHTVGHAIELTSHIKHGDAVALGMIIELNMSIEMGYASKEIFSRLKRVIDVFQFPIERSFSYTDLFHAVLHDKKRNTTELDFPVVTGIGKSQLLRIKMEQWGAILSNVLTSHEP